MRNSFMGNDLSQTYPIKQLYNRGAQIVPFKGKYPRSSAVSEILNSDPSKIIATAIGERIKGGGPDFDEYRETSSKEKSPSNGRRKGGSGGNGNNNDSKRRSESDYSKSSNTRGYQTQPGISCFLFSSGISSGLTVNTRVVSGDYTPLYLSSGKFFHITDANINGNSPFLDQLRNIIYPLIESTISNKIQRYAGRYINSVDFEDYIMALVDALQVYYCIDNVLTYGSNNTITNINVGMEHLRTYFSAESIVEFNLLRETLETCNCPNNLLDYIRFMCQSYRLSDAPHSPIIKLNIGGMFDKEWMLGTNHIESVLTKCRFNLIKNYKMVSYLHQAFPSWIISSMPSSSNEACYNPDFMSFWHNQNCCFMSTKSANNGNFEYTIDTPNLDSYTDYQIIQDVDRVDGVIFTSQTYNIKNITEKSKPFDTFWGVWQPLASVDDKNTTAGDFRYTFNIKCFTVNSSIESCIDSTMLGASGIYNLVEYRGAPGNWTANLTKFGAHGFVKLQNVSVRMQTEAFNNTMRFWFT